MKPLVGPADARSRSSGPAACCGRTSRTTAAPSSSSATSASGRSTWTPAARPQVPIRRRGASIGPVTEHLSLTTGFTEPGALAGRPQGRVRRARRDLRRVGARRRRCRPRHAQPGQRSADHVGARQPAHRLRLRARRRESHLHVRLRRRAPRRSSRTTRRATMRRSFRRTARCSRSCATTSPWS